MTLQVLASPRLTSPVPSSPLRPQPDANMGQSPLHSWPSLPLKPLGLGKLPGPRTELLVIVPSYHLGRSSESPGVGAGEVLKKKRILGLSPTPREFHVICLGAARH